MSEKAILDKIKDLQIELERAGFEKVGGGSIGGRLLIELVKKAPDDPRAPVATTWWVLSSFAAIYRASGEFRDLPVEERIELQDYLREQIKITKAVLAEKDWSPPSEISQILEISAPLQPSICQNFSVVTNSALCGTCKRTWAPHFNPRDHACSEFMNSLKKSTTCLRCDWTKVSHEEGL